MNVDIKRKGKIYNKTVYIILTNYMYENVDNCNILQYFSDVTYYATPTVSKKYKIWTLLGFDVKERKTKLCTMALIQNELFETFASIFLELKNHFNYSPHYITSDFNKAMIKAIKFCFPEAVFIPCYFHFIQNCLKHFPDKNSSNEEEKKTQAQDLLEI